MFTRTQRILSALAAAALVLGLAGAAQAQAPGGRGVPAYGRPLPYQPVNPGIRPPAPVPDSRHMPGWDWKYLYPQVYYSTHGYWPYPYPSVYPYAPAWPVNPYNPVWPYGSAVP
jgi:hypothetical protein